jgi:hypothetical protein
LKSDESPAKVFNTARAGVRHFFGELCDRDAWTRGSYRGGFPANAAAKTYPVRVMPCAHAPAADENNPQALHFAVGLFFGWCCAKNIGNRRMAEFPPKEKRVGLHSAVLRELMLGPKGLRIAVQRTTPGTAKIGLS